MDRTLPEGLGAAVAEGDAQSRASANVRAEVTWLHSYLSVDRRRMLCLYEAPSPEAVRHASALNALPIDSITEVVLVDPFAYRPTGPEAPPTSSGVPTGRDRPHETREPR